MSRVLKGRLTCVSLGLMCTALSVFAQQQADGPTNEKARKIYKRALEYLKKRDLLGALGDFKKADKEDSGRCFACQRRMVQYGMELGEWKTAEQGAEEIVAEATGERDMALAHYQIAVVFTSEGFQKHKDEFFTRAHEEIGKALASSANFPDALFTDGRVLAQLRQDDAAKDRFEQFVKMKSGDDPNCQRALRYISHPELARARMAPAFAITTVGGQRISLDDLQGSVVLLDFWATWCAPCREALPHIRDIARKFQGQPLVILSVSLDDEEQKWKEFISKNEMTWPQYCDGGFSGPMAKMFGVKAIPHTFTIDADGVLQDEHIGDTSIEGKLKKLMARAREGQPTETQLSP